MILKIGTYKYACKISYAHLYSCFKTSHANQYFSGVDVERTRLFKPKICGMNTIMILD